LRKSQEDLYNLAARLVWGRGVSHWTRTAVSQLGDVFCDDGAIHPEEKVITVLKQ